MELYGEWEQHTVTVASINQEATAGLSANNANQYTNRLNCASGTMNDCRVSRSNPMYPMSSHVCRPRALVSAPDTMRRSIYMRRGIHAGRRVCMRRGMHAPGVGMHAPGMRRERRSIMRRSMHAPGVMHLRRRYACRSMHAERRSMHAPG
jgi:hypothetical protein